MKNNRNVIEYFNNTHQGALRTGKQTSACASDLGDGSHVTCSVCMCVCDFCLSVNSEEDEESDGVASNQSAEDGSVNENMNNYSNNGSTGMCITQILLQVQRLVVGL